MTTSSGLRDNAAERQDDSNVNKLIQGEEEDSRKLGEREEDDEEKRQMQQSDVGKRQMK